jgi:hypothetical protein
MIATLELFAAVGISVADGSTAIELRKFYETYRTELSALAPM